MKQKQWSFRTVHLNSESISEEICISAAKMANNLEVDALFVYTKTGHMTSLFSCSPLDSPVFAFTNTTSMRRRLNLQWGLIRLDFSDDDQHGEQPEQNLLLTEGKRND